MPEKPSPVSPKPRRKFWRRIWRGSLWTVLILAIIHRPLILIGGPFIARKLALKQHLNASFSLGGTIFTNLTVSNVAVTPTGTGPTPVKSIKIDQLRFDYSIWRLARKGIGEFLSSYELHRATLSFVALPSKTAEEKKNKQSIAETLRTILGQPATYSDRVLIEDFNIKVESAKAVTEVKNLNLLLDPVNPGYLKIALIQIPGLPKWEGIDGTTSYVRRNLYQRNLRLSPDVVIDELNFDASHRAEGRGLVAIKSTVYGGKVDLLLTGEEKGEGKHLKKNYVTQLLVGIKGVRVHDAAAYFGVKNVPLNVLDELLLDFTGEPEKPQSWNGNAKLGVSGIQAGKIEIPKVGATAHFANGQAELAANVTIGGNSTTANATVTLPAEIDGWLDAAGTASVRVAAPDLPSILQPFSQSKAGGSIDMDATASYRQRKATVDLKVGAVGVTFDQLSSETFNAQVAVTKTIDPAQKNPLAGLDGSIALNSKSLRAGTFAIDSIAAQVGAAGGAITVQDLSVIRGSNTVKATASAKLPDDLAQSGDRTTGAVDLQIHVPALSEFGIKAGENTLGGKLETIVHADVAGKVINGSASIAGGQFTVGQFQTGDLVGTINMKGQEIDMGPNGLVLAFNATDKLAIQGRFNSADPMPYEGGLQLSFKDLAALQPLLTAFGVKDAVTGALSIAWKGNGSIAAKSHTGSADVTLHAAKYGTFAINDVKIAGGYGPDSASAEISATAGPTKLQTRVSFQAKQLTIRDLILEQGDQKALTGELGVSLDTEGGQKPDFMRQPIRVSLQANQLDIEKLLTSVGKTNVASGKVTMHLAATGTPIRPEVEFSLQGRGLKSKAAAQFDPAEIDVSASYKPGQVKLSSSIRQPLIQPMTLHAEAPLDLETVVTEKKVPGNLAVSAQLKMPPSSLAVLPKLVPAVRRIEGTAAIDVSVKGTVEKPEVGGSATVSIRNARLADENVPAIGQFDANLVFAGDTLKFERFRGEVGGGTFELGGAVKLASLDNPGFDLGLKARQVLVKRDDSITVRADADIKVGGTLQAGSVTGEIDIVQSRFFKEIDILPIGLPGRPKPAPKSAPSEPNVSLPPPLDKWKIDLLIKTRQDDPFLIRGNLANGSVSLSLHVGNTGPQPWLEGSVTIDQFKASLPFSTLTMESGHIYFTQNAPLVPTLDLNAQSKVRDITVNAYIYGSAYEPQIQFTSDPPLPHADIVSVLATGSTTSDLAGNADVLASRAAMLAVQSLWRKVFKRGSAPPPSSKSNDDSFLDRFELELGGIDNKTGAREATAKFKINDQIYLLGELDTQGRYTGSLKYLLRFR